MKLFAFILISLLSLSSCIEEINRIGCGEITNVEFDSQDSVWLPIVKDTIICKSSTGEDVVLSLLDSDIFNEEADGGCTRPISFVLDYFCNRKIGRVYSSITKYDSKNKINSTITYAFSQITDNLIPVTQQVMGSIDVRTNRPVDKEITRYVKTTKLGTHELNGEIYNDVFLIEDLDKNNVPEIDIFRFYVNPSGILRIEFYDGEIWDRID